MFVNTRNLKELSVTKTECDRATGVSPCPGTGGFSLIEVTVVLILAGVAIGMAGGGLSGYSRRIAANRAAQLFARDLSLARAQAVRGRESVVIRFSESSRWYSISTMGTERTGFPTRRRPPGISHPAPILGVPRPVDTPLHLV